MHHLSFFNVTPFLFRWIFSFRETIFYLSTFCHRFVHVANLWFAAQRFDAPAIASPKTGIARRETSLRFILRFGAPVFGMCRWSCWWQSRGLKGGTNPAAGHGWNFWKVKICITLEDEKSWEPRNPPTLEKERRIWTKPSWLRVQSANFWGVSLQTPSFHSESKQLPLIVLFLVVLCLCLCRSKRCVCG